MARVAVAGFHHETNTFSPTVTDFAYFAAHRDRPPLVRGAEVLEHLPSAGFPLSGFMTAVAGRHEVVPLVWTSGGAGGYVTRDAYERIVGEIVGGLSRALPVDAVYLDLHGAMVSEDEEDGEGELLRRVRAAVGPAIPIVVSLDYHANLTRAMVDHSDAIVPFLTYPHVDRVETGVRAAHALDAVLAGGRPPGRALRKLPFLIPLHCQCTLVDPSRSIVDEAVRLEGGNDVLTVGYLAGFPPADIRECGPGIAVYAATQEAADRAADALARTVALAEPMFAAPVLDPDEAVRQARDLARTATRPVVLADTQDNPGAGGSADTTDLLAALVRGGAVGAVMGFFFDAPAAAAAHGAGEGAEIHLALGGRHGPPGVVPFEAGFRVLRLGDGRLTGSGPMARGRAMELGPMALLETGGVKVVVTSKRTQALDQAPFRHLGIEPARQPILALKSSVHFRADFEPIAERVLVVGAPGHHLADTTRYPFRNLRTGIRLAPLGPDMVTPG